MIDDKYRRRLEGRVFCVIKYYIGMVGTDERCANYEVVFHPAYNTKHGNFLVSREDAVQIIEEYDLVRALRNSSGAVYDTSDMAFLKKFEGYYQSRPV